MLDVNNLGTGWVTKNGIAARARHNTHVINGQIYIVGGRISATNLNTNTYTLDSNFTFQRHRSLNIPGGMEFFASIAWNV